MIKVIEDILSPSVAEHMTNFIEEYPAHWWRDAVCSHGKDAKYYTQSLYDQRMKQGQFNQLSKSLQSGFFSYSFTRSTKHAKDCKCDECKFRDDFLNDPDFKKLIGIYSGLNNPVLFEHFISVYKPGDFLSTHTDVGRDVAFIINLSRDWKPEYGGLLHVKKPDGSIEAFVPKFNSLILLGLENGKGLHHFVSEVSARAPHPRLAITGWYNEQDS